MPGLIAVIAHDRRAVVEESEVDELATVYRSLRGESILRRASAGEHARAMELGVEPDTTPSPPTSSSWVVTAGIRDGDSAVQPHDLERLEGQFGWIAYDSDSDEVAVGTDSFGMFAVYFAHRDGKTYVATSALVLANYLRATPSELGIKIFLRAGYHFGRVTNWEGIARVDPGSRLVFGASGPRYETYWRPEVDGAVAKMNLVEAVRHCCNVACATYAHVLGPDRGTWADLTGGFDTRLLALLLRRAGVDFRSTTTGNDDNLDVRIAKRIAELGGWEWFQVKLPGDWPQVIGSILPTSVAWSDGHLDVLQLARVLWAHREKTWLSRSLLIGGGGEHFRNFTWQQEFLNAGKTSRVNLDNWVDMRLLHPMDMSVLVEDPTDEVRSDLEERMVAWASPYASERNTTQLDVMYAYKITGHFGAYLSAAGAYIEPQLPFYFRPVFVGAFSTDYRHRNNHRLMRHMIAALDERIAAIGTVTGGPAEPWRLSNLHRFLPYYGNLARRAVTKLTQTTTGRPILAPSPTVDERIVSARRAILEQLSKDGALTPSEMRAGRLFKLAALEELLERAARPDFPDDELLGRIITIELALRAADASLDG
jgi:hypothetical protein